MKTKLLILTVPFLLNAQSVKPDLSWVDKEVAAIKPPRKGVRLGTLSSLRNPFKAQMLLYQTPVKTGSKKSTQTVSVEPVEQKPFSLQAIFNSKSAKIDGRWYEIGEKVHGYSVVSIAQDKVVLQRKKKKLKLSLKLKNDKIKINAK